MIIYSLDIQLFLLEKLFSVKSFLVTAFKSLKVLSNILINIRLDVPFIINEPEIFNYLEFSQYFLSVITYFRKTNKNWDINQ